VIHEKKNYGEGGLGVGCKTCRGDCAKKFIFISVILPEESQTKFDVRESVHIIHSVRLVLRAVERLACEGQFRRLKLRSWVTEKWLRKEENIYRQLNSCNKYW